MQIDTTIWAPRSRAPTKRQRETREPVGTFETGFRVVAAAALSSFSSAYRVGLHGFCGSAPGRWWRWRSGVVGIPGREQLEWEEEIGGGGGRGGARRWQEGMEAAATG
ncbi:hypothetical protein GUJ93_ZPchr0008g12757 [Zizania palustris]|uniref:Uncharacterized protein n=1 Tax=Zizania palustris TaxID=103762 RepID=A0A8J5RPE5_ZIZPA|nr:hypothetical protein GUJ93_ZPchr0008g12757 [Zizania palustris]